MQTGKAISIPSILKVGNGTLNKIGEYLKSEELTSVVIFMGNGLIDMFGDAIMKSLSDADITDRKCSTGGGNIRGCISSVFWRKGR